MNRYCAWLSVTLALALTWSPLAAAQDMPRIALVIGNSGYKHTRVLANPANDVAAVAKVLRQLRFEVTEKLDLDYLGFRDAVRTFGAKAGAADIALIHFAGHGLELAGENYLLPVDARLARDVDLEYEAITLTSLLRATLGAKTLRMVILDACRNNPLSDKMVLATGTGRSVSRGLARVEPQGNNVLVAFSARAGTLAKDGDGPTSPYAAALVKHLASPGLDIRLVFGRVRDDVVALTKDEQEPYTYGSLKGDIISLLPGPSGISEAARQEFLRFAAEATARMQADEAEAKRQVEEATRKRREAEAEADRLRREAEQVMEEAEQKRRVAEEAKAAAERQRREAEEAREEAERQQRTAEEEAERQRQAELEKQMTIRICNNSAWNSDIALSYYSRQHNSWVVEGWWQVGPGNCSAIKTIEKGDFYLFGDAGNGRKWAGSDVHLCVDFRRFFYVNDGPRTCYHPERGEGFYKKSSYESEFTWNLGN